METNFDQLPQTAEERLIDEHRQTLIGQIGGLLRSGYEAIPRNVRVGVALGATVFVAAQAAELTLNAEPVSGEGNTPARVSTPEAGVVTETAHSSATTPQLHSKLRIQPILNKIHNVLQPFAVDTLAAHKGGDNICGLRGLVPHIPKYPKCKHAYATLTSAFLTPSSGGFSTKCDNPAAVTYHYYDIYTYGQKYHTCGPGPNPGGLGGEQHTTPGQFQAKLNHIGDTIQKSAGLSRQGTTTRVGVNPKKITARYQCPEPAANPSLPGTTPQPTGIQKIVIRRNHTASVTVC